MQRRPPRGNYLLEAAVVTFGAAFFVVGATDVSRILHARSAVRAGVREGLRCLYPTESGCAAPSGQDAAASTARYNVSVWDETLQFVAPTEIWSAEASWVTEPELLVPLESTGVSAVTVELARDRYRERDVLFPVQGHHPYLVQQRTFPLIGGTDPLNPEFRDRLTHGRVAPHRVVDVASIRGTTRLVPTSAQSGFEPQFRIGSVQFSVRDAWPARATELPEIRATEQAHGVQVPCYAAELAKGASPARIDWSRHSSLPPLCRYRNDARLFTAEGLRVPIMLRLSGTTRGTSSLGQGKVLIQLRWTLGNERGEQRLGGRLISAGASGNFVVRGAALDDIALNTRAPYEKGGPYFEELRDNGTIMLVPAAAQLYLDVFLVSRNGAAVSWQGGDLELFYPSFSFFPERYSCELSVDPAACVGSVPVRPLYTSLELARSLASADTPSTSCQRDPPAGHQPDPSAYLEALRARLVSGESAKRTAFWASDAAENSACTPTTKRLTCEGKPREHLKGCGECEERQERKLPDGCAEPLFNPARDKVTELSCRTVSLERVERRLACSGAELPSCARTHAEQGGDFLWGGDAASCSSATPHRAGPVESDPVLVSKCGAVPPIEDLLRSEQRVPAEVSVSLSRRAWRDSILPQAPDDSCIDYRQELRRSPERLCGSSLSSAAASQCCAQSGGRCILRTVSLPEPGTLPGGGELRLAPALERTARTIEAAYPQAVRRDSCAAGQAHCLAVSAEELAPQGEAAMRASISVPLRLGELFGQQSVAVEHREARKIERALVAEDSAG